MLQTDRHVRYKCSIYKWCNEYVDFYNLFFNNLGIHLTFMQWGHTNKIFIFRESRREKILSAIQKEARLKGRAKKMMIDPNMMGGDTEKDREKDPVYIAEKKFFEILKAQKDQRLKQNKPLIFNDDE